MKFTLFPLIAALAFAEETNGNNDFLRNRKLQGDVDPALNKFRVPPPVDVSPLSINSYGAGDI